MLGDSGETPYTYSQLLTDAGAGKIKAITMDGDRLAVTFQGDQEPTKTAVAPPGSQGTEIYNQICNAAGHTTTQECAAEIQFNPVEPSAAGSIITPADHRTAAGAADRRLHLLHDAPGAGHQ